MAFNYAPKIGDFVVPDKWIFGEKLETDDGYSDTEFPGCQFRLRSTPRGVPLGSLAVNIKITGRDLQYHWNGQRLRVKIEFVGDGEPSQFTGGWLFPRNQ